MGDLATGRDTRDAGGRFRKGHCPNPAGRPRKNRTSPPLPLQLRRAILMLANRTVQVTHADGSRERMTMFEHRVLRLATARGRKRQAWQAFVELVLQASAQEEQLARDARRASDVQYSQLWDAIANGDDKEFAALAHLLDGHLPVSAMSDTTLIRLVEQMDVP